MLLQKKLALVRFWVSRARTRPRNAGRSIWPQGPLGRLTDPASAESRAQPIFPNRPLGAKTTHMQRWAILFWVCMMGAPVQAERLTVAVASNFLTTARDIVAAFEAETGHEVALVHGSTGKLFAQISAGAPFDLFLSADQDRAARVQDAGQGASATRTYAEGRLALVHGARTAPGTLEEILRRPGLRIAIADPAVAPYGVAARDLLQELRAEDWDAGVVLGESVGQAFTFVATGNADAGLVALAQAMTFEGRLWVLEVDPARHSPILQDAVLLTRAADSTAAQAFWAFLFGPFAQQVIQSAGYAERP